MLTSLVVECLGSYGCEENGEGDTRDCENEEEHVDLLVFSPTVEYSSEGLFLFPPTHGTGNKNNPRGRTFSLPLKREAQGE